MNSGLPRTTMSNVCSSTVAADLCVGCGVCAGICPTKNLSMKWTRYGLLQPYDEGKCLPSCRLCLDVCPFWDHTLVEDTIGADLFSLVGGNDHTVETGYLLGSWVGYAQGGYRERGASGGLASWFLARLIEAKTVDHVICVRSKEDAECLFEFTVLSTVEEVNAAAKSAYYPVELSEVLHYVMKNEGKYAIIALPCFVKAIRLASARIPLLKRRIVILAGLVCGQTKSKLFTEYLIHHMGLNPKEVTRLNFRSKNPNRPAGNFEMRARTRKGVEGVCVWGGLYTKTWCSGMFSPRACAFCDDVFAELSDICFMDAWLPQYVGDSRGTSLVLTRSVEAERILSRGVAENAITLNIVAVDQIRQSQEAVSEWKRRDLAWRLWLEKNSGRPVPGKRVRRQRPPVWHAMRLRLRENLRRFSFAAWPTGGEFGCDTYKSAFKAIRLRLRIYLLYLSLPGWGARIQRFPFWLIKKLWVAGLVIIS